MPSLLFSSIFQAMLPVGQSRLVRLQKAAALFNAGKDCHRDKNFDAAIDLYRKALEIDSKHFEAAYLIACIAAQSDNPELINSAEKHFLRALAINPKNEACLINYGNFLQQNNQFEAAIDVYRKVIKANPGAFHAYMNLGTTFGYLKKYDEALDCYQKSIELNPRFTEAHINRGSLLMHMKRYQDGLNDYAKAIALNPNNAQAYFNRGNYLYDSQQFHKAIKDYIKATNLEPQSAKIHLNLSHAYLATGQYEKGFKEYEWRWLIPRVAEDKARKYPQPLWLGKESLKGKTIFLYAEQGLGDTIQFARYIPMVAQLGAKVIVEVQKPLLGVLSNIAGASTILTKDDPYSDFDYHSPLMSLPLAFKTVLDSIPKPLAIKSNAQVTSKWSMLLGQRNKPRIGLVWSGSSYHPNDHNRSLSLAQLLPFLPEGFEYICLQKEVREADRAVLADNPHIRFVGDQIADFSDTAALCELMDLVISVDTSVAHLAGTLNKTTYLLIPFKQDWRWLAKRVDSPWYPSIYIFRQESDEDWSSAFQNLQQKLLETGKI